MYNDKCDRANIFLRLAEDYCRQLMERKDSPPHQNNIKHHQLCFFAESAFLDAVVLVNFISLTIVYLVTSMLCNNTSF